VAAEPVKLRRRRLRRRPHPDHLLIGMVDLFLKADAESDAASLAADALPVGSPERKAAFRKLDRDNQANDYCGRMERIAGEAATTVAGLKAKARVLLAHYGTTPNNDEIVAWSLANDILNIGEQPIQQQGEFTEVIAQLIRLWTGHEDRVLCAAINQAS
jgi:hypothetical protein